MNMSKICMINNMAASYRASIYRLMDQSFDIDWYFGEQIGNIKEMDLSELKVTNKLKSNIIVGPLYWQKGILKLLRDNTYESYIVLGELFSLSTWAMLILKPFIAPKKRIFLWSHGWYGREGWLKKWIKRVFFSLPNGSFIYGDFAKKVAVSQGNNSDKLHVIHNSLNHDKHIVLRENIEVSDIYSKHFGNKNRTIIFIGRLTTVKKLDMIIDSVKILADKNELYNVVFVGDGPQKKWLEDKANKSGIPVWFYGECYDEETNAQLIVNADLCVAPGNVGLTSIHSLTFGTPVITHGNFTTQMPEFEAIKKGETGDFFIEDSIESLALTISEWFKKHPNREYVRKKCYNEIDNYWTPEFQIRVLKNVIK